MYLLFASKYIFLWTIIVKPQSDTLPNVRIFDVPSGVNQLAHARKLSRLSIFLLNQESSDRIPLEVTFLLLVRGFDAYIDNISNLVLFANIMN